MRKGFVLLLIIAIATVGSAFAQSIPKPSVPEFTLKCVDYSYDVPPTYKIDEYTGKTVVASGGYHVKNMTIEVTVRNQIFSRSSDGVIYHLYYNVRFKGHFGKDWSETSSVVTLNSSPSSFSEYVSLHDTRLREQSTSEYTTFSFSASDYPPNAPIDFQVEAVLGHDSQAWVPAEPYAPANPAHYYAAVAFDETSGWSDTQTVTIPAANDASQTLLLGIIIGTVVALVLVSAGLLLYRRKRRREAQQQ